MAGQHSLNYPLSFLSRYLKRLVRSLVYLPDYVRHAGYYTRLCQTCRILYQIMSDMLNIISDYVRHAGYYTRLCQTCRILYQIISDMPDIIPDYVRYAGYYTRLCQTCRILYQIMSDMPGWKYESCGSWIRSNMNKDVLWWEGARLCEATGCALLWVI